MQKRSPLAVEEQIIIDADIDTVWQFMTDWDGYHTWNPFIVDVEVQRDQNGAVDRMKFHLQWADGKKETSLEQMVRATPPQDGSAELVYKYASLLAKLGLLRGVRTQQLRARGHQTEYYTREDFYGILARFVPFEAVQQGFTAQAKALAAVAAANPINK